MFKFISKAILLAFVLMLHNVAFCDNVQGNLKDKFDKNQAIILAINLRSFNSTDINNDGFIQEDLGETRGTFINAISRLDEVKNLGINTLHLLPITPTGKINALGTAGSLYSLSSFDTINEDIIDKNSKLSPTEQAKEFIKQAHARNINIIIDIPACGSYDLFLKNPNLFILDDNNQPIIPSDWSDVRLFDVGTKEEPNIELLDAYKSFVDMAIEIGADGIRVDVAHSKPAFFWKELIEYSHSKSPQLLWLAESSDSWHEPISSQVVFTPYNELLESGFDSYYASFMNLKDWKYSKDFNNQINFTLKDLANYQTKKSVIGSFTTHDEKSPVALKGEKFSIMMIWLNSTLPINSYYVDGFQTGDNYFYKAQNQKSEKTYTDSNIYYTHPYQIDIFNLSRKPQGDNTEIKNNFILGNNVKNSLSELLNKGNFKTLKTNSPEVFAYSTQYNNKTLLTIGNLDFEKSKNISIKLQNFNQNKKKLLPLKITKMPTITHNKLLTTLNPGEIVVFIITE